MLMKFPLLKVPVFFIYWWCWCVCEIHHGCKWSLSLGVNIVPKNLRIAPFLTPEYTDDEFQYIIKEVMGVLYVLLEFYVLKVIAMFYFVSYWSEINDFIFDSLTIYIFGILWLGWVGIFWDFSTQSLAWLAFLCSRRFGNDNDCRNWHKTDNAPNYVYLDNSCFFSSLFPQF